MKRNQESGIGNQADVGCQVSGVGDRDQGSILKTLDGLSEGAKQWLNDVCHQCADAGAYIDCSEARQECETAGLLVSDGREIEISAEVMNLVYSESYFLKGYDDFINELAEECSCCPECQNVPCDGLLAGSPCDNYCNCGGEF